MNTIIGSGPEKFQIISRLSQFDTTDFLKLISSSNNSKQDEFYKETIWESLEDKNDVAYELDPMLFTDENITIINNMIHDAINDILITDNDKIKRALFFIYSKNSKYLSDNMNNLHCGSFIHYIFNKKYSAFLHKNRDICKYNNHNLQIGDVVLFAKPINIKQRYEIYMQYWTAKSGIIDDIKICAPDEETFRGVFSLKGFAYHMIYSQSSGKIPDENNEFIKHIYDKRNEFIERIYDKRNKFIEQIYGITSTDTNYEEEIFVGQEKYHFALYIGEDLFLSQFGDGFAAVSNEAFIHKIYSNPHDPLKKRILKDKKL